MPENKPQITPQMVTESIAILCAVAQASENGKLHSEVRTHDGKLFAINVELKERS